MKDIILVVSVLLALGLSVVVFRFAEKATKAGKSLEEERYSRMVAEETLQKNDAKLNNLQQSLKEDHDKMVKIQDILDQEKGVNSDLKKQFDGLKQAKADLEAKLQKAQQEKINVESALQAQIKTEATASVNAQSAGEVQIPVAR